MRASHMPSLPEMPFEHHHQHQDQGQTRRMKLKILYTLDENTYLARSNNVLNIKTLQIPIPGQRTMMTMGVVPLKNVLQPISNSSPELFTNDSVDYSVYVKDISEEDEPFVGYGLFNKLLNGEATTDYDDDDEFLIPGRVCSNFAALLSKNTSETLEIKLRLARVVSRKSQQPQQQQQQQQTQAQSQSQSQQSQQSGSKSGDKRKFESDSQAFPQPAIFQVPQQHYQSQSMQQNKQRKPSTTSIQNTLSANVAQKAVRTQSLPVFDQPLNQLNPSQLISMGLVPPSSRMFPTNSIASKIRQADVNNSMKKNYSFQVDGVGESNPEPITVPAANRFAPDFIMAKSAVKKQINQNSSKQSKKQTTKAKSQPKSTAKNSSVNKSIIDSSARSSPIPSNVNILPKPNTTNNAMASSTAPIFNPKEQKSIPECFNCTTVSSNVWRWFDSDEESKRGMYCNACYVYLIDKGIQRPRSLYNRNRKKNDSAITSSSPSVHAKSQYNQNSSDPADGLNDVVSSDLDFAFAPMTDIDPLPQAHLQQQGSNSSNNQSKNATPSIEDKENIPPISIKAASRQNSFEKMLIKSFSGVPPNITSQTPNNEWFNDFFEPTPKDNNQESITPKDFDNTPRDLATCNTIPCEDESPNPSSQAQSNDQETQPQQQQQQISDKESKMKTTTALMPSSPYLNGNEHQSSSPDTVNDTSDWLSEHTKLSSMDADDDHLSK